MLFVSEEREASALEPQACLSDLSGAGAEPMHQAKAKAATGPTGPTQCTGGDKLSVVHGLHERRVDVWQAFQNLQCGRRL